MIISFVIKIYFKEVSIVCGWGRGIRTPECQYQKLVPYRLAIPQYEKKVLIIINLFFLIGCGNRI